VVVWVIFTVFRPAGYLKIMPCAMLVVLPPSVPLWRAQRGLVLTAIVV